MLNKNQWYAPYVWRKMLGLKLIATISFVKILNETLGFMTELNFVIRPMRKDKAMIKKLI